MTQIIDNTSLLATPPAPSLHPAPFAAVGIHDLLTQRARQTPTLEILLAPNRLSMTCEELLQHSEKIAAQLNAWGITKTDRVASIIAPGPEAITLMSAVACAAIYAPINVNLHPDEIRKALSEVNAKAVIIEDGLLSPGYAPAAACNLPIIELTPTSDAPAGTFNLTCDNPPSKIPAPRQVPHPSDVFFLLQTSGTTARPKLVPLTHQAFLSNVTQNTAALQLTPADRIILVLSVAHVMGITTTYSSIFAAAQIVCIPPFAPADFFTYYRHYQPTWINSPPAIHRSILNYAESHLDFIQQHPPRFIRTGASAMPMSLLLQLEKIWHAPLVEGYGMSEYPIISSNSLAHRKRGSGGRAVATKIAILTPDGILHKSPAPNLTGEVAVQGPGLMHAYANNPQANADSYLDNYFRTGDLGYLDEDGYLFIVGRNKEIIDRGGYKIAPREIDEIIFTHPAVADAVTFPIPDPRLGEIVAVAVVLKPNTQLTETQLRQFAAQHLTFQKVPQRVFFLDKIPTGATGKPKRIDLAKKLNIQPASSEPRTYVPPRTSIEQDLAALWAFVLRIKTPISVEDRFMDLGGDSLQAVAMFAELDRLLGRSLPVQTLIEHPTIASLAQVLSNETVPTERLTLAKIQTKGARPPIFCLPGMYGNAFTFYPLSQSLGDDQPLYGFQLPQTDGATPNARNVKQLATQFLIEIRAIQPHGPYQLVGYSYGGIVAYEIAQQLLEQNQHTSLLALFDTKGPTLPRSETRPMKLRRHAKALLFATEGNPLAYAKGLLSRRLKSPPTSNEANLTPNLINPRLEQQSFNAIYAYRAKPYPGPLLIFRAATQPPRYPERVDDPNFGWSKYVKNLTIHWTPGDHGSLLSAPNAPQVAQTLSSHLQPPHS